MHADDGHYYIVIKTILNTFASSPTSCWRRELPSVSLPVPVTEVIEVSSWLIENTPDLRIRTGSTTVMCQPGLALAVRFVIAPLEGQVYDYIPASVLDRVRNLEAFAGMLAFDKWTCNTNGRQAV